MFNPGDYLMYSVYGPCIVDEITEKTTGTEKKMYYILHPINETNSTKIITPINNKKVKMRAIITPEIAEEIINVIFKDQVIRVTDKKQRELAYGKILKEGNPCELAEIINALKIEETEKIAEGKKFSATDSKYLERAERLLYSELSISLNMKIEQIKDRITEMFIQQI
jgi:CarD family transcriptional regulator